jgi:chloramphenicol O-acetyltransferase type A
MAIREMVKEIKPEETSRESAFYLWMKAPNPMLTLFKKIDVTNLVKVSKKDV